MMINTQYGQVESAYRGEQVRRGIRGASRRPTRIPGLRRGRRSAR